MDILFKNKRFILMICIVLTIVVGCLDYITGYELDFLIFYFVPITISAWFVDKYSSLMITFLCIISWFLADLYAEHKYSLPHIIWWNAVVICLSFIIVALLLSWLREALHNEKQLNIELSKALSEVKQLKRLIPICAWCKRVRNDDGYWEQVEVYLSNHASIDFTHGMCQDCKAKMLAESKVQLPKK